MRETEPTHYQDNGCHLSPSCLNCPFPRCYEEGGIFGIKRALVQQEIEKLHQNGIPIKKEELKAKFNVSNKTINRVLARGV